MRILIAGACGFVGSSLADAWIGAGRPYTLLGCDSLVRPGSELNRRRLRQAGVRCLHADLRAAEDVAALPDADWVVDAAAEPSVTAGVDGRTSSRQVVAHNLLGTLNLLEYCKRRGSGLVLLSTSRVYAAEDLAALPLTVDGDAYRPEWEALADPPAGLGPAGVCEDFSTRPPLSLYGATKLAAETLALEYGAAFGFPVWVDRCGLLAGAGQFGRPDQGIVAFWIHSWRRGASLGYIGFDGRGHQVRDCLHPRDLARLIDRQMRQRAAPGRRRCFNVAGGAAGAFSLRGLSRWCEARFGPREVGCEPRTRPGDVPWLVLDAERARQAWDWRPTVELETIFSEVADHAERRPDWLDLSGLP